MKITIINGSPKIGKSTTQLLMSYLIKNIEKQDVEIFNINKSLMNEAQIERVRSSDALVIAFPLYIDSIPAHLLRQLIMLEKIGFDNKNVKVYCIVNNGFFEGKQNRIVIEQIKFWCNRAKLIWGQGLGVGAGEMIPIVQNIPLGHGPNKNIGIAIETIAQNITSGNHGDDMLVYLNWPRFLWRIQASTMVWLPRAKANGVKRRKMYERLK